MGDILNILSGEFAAKSLLNCLDKSNKEILLSWSWFLDLFAIAFFWFRFTSCCHLVWSSLWSLATQSPTILFSLFYCQNHCVCFVYALFRAPLFWWSWAVFSGWSFRGWSFRGWSFGGRLTLTLMRTSFCFGFGFGFRLTFVTSWFRRWSSLWCLWVVFIFDFIWFFFFLFLWLFSLLFFSQLPLFRAYSFLSDTFGLSFMLHWVHICLFRLFSFLWFSGSSWSFFTCFKMPLRIAVSQSLFEIWVTVNWPLIHELLSFLDCSLFSRMMNF